MILSRTKRQAAKQRQHALDSSLNYRHTHKMVKDFPMPKGVKQRSFDHFWVVATFFSGSLHIHDIYETEDEARTEASRQEGLTNREHMVYAKVLSSPLTQRQGDTCTITYTINTDLGLG